MRYAMVELSDGTVGCLYGNLIGDKDINDCIGDTVTVRTHDDNGELIEVTGQLSEILEIE